MKEFFLNFAMHWFNFTYIKTNRHIQTDTSIRVRKFKDWTVPCSRPASTFPNFSPYSSQRTTVGTLSSRPSSQGGPPEIEIQSSCKEGHFSTRVPSCRPECWEIRRKTPSKFQYSTTSWSFLWLPIGPQPVRYICISVWQRVWLTTQATTSRYRIFIVRVSTTMWRLRPTLTISM